MPSVLQLRRGTTSQNNAFTGAAGELSYDTEVDTIRAVSYTHLTLPTSR